MRSSAELDGKDAFEALKALVPAGNNGNGTSGIPAQLSKPLEDARADLERLVADATEGMPVAGRKDTWAASRPSVQPSGTAAKPRGFIDYNRCGHVPVPPLSRHAVICTRHACVSAMHADRYAAAVADAHGCSKCAGWTKSIIAFDQSLARIWWLVGGPCWPS